MMRNKKLKIYLCKKVTFYCFNYLNKVKFYFVEFMHNLSESIINYIFLKKKFKLIIQILKR